jgi:hypothetical protein
MSSESHQGELQLPTQTTQTETRTTTRPTTVGADTTTATSGPRTTAAAGAAHSLATRVPAAVLALGVAWIHVTDQGGFPGDKTPSYVGVGYYVLEVVAALVAVALLFGPARQRLATWLAAAAVAFGPLVGYVLSRGPGLPAYTDDRGNWTEPLGLASLAVEGALLLLSLAAARTLTVADDRG